MNNLSILLFLGTSEIIILVLLVVLLFGAKKIPELMKSLGKGVSSFKKGMREGDEDNIDQNIK